jgi:hypothetical protein
MPIEILESVKSALGFGEEKSSSPNPTAYIDNMSKEQKQNEKLDYQSDTVYFKRRKDFGKVSKESPGAKFNRSQIDALVYARNTGVSLGLLSDQDGDLFIANQLVESRNDFAVNTVVPGKDGLQANFIGDREGKVPEAAKALYGIKPGGKEDQFVNRLGRVAADKERGLGARYIPMAYRSETEKMFSPYTEDMSPEKYQTNAKLALFSYLSKKNKGESPEKVAKDWNGAGTESIRHMQRVIEAKEDLLHENNSGLKQYISDRLSDDRSSYKVKGSSPTEEKSYRKKYSVPEDAYYIPLGKDENINRIYQREAVDNGFVIRKFGEKSYAVPMETGEVEPNHTFEGAIGATGKFKR